MVGFTPQPVYGPRPALMSPVSALLGLSCSLSAGDRICDMRLKEAFRPLTLVPVAWLRVLRKELFSSRVAVSL